jgi:hypothetical protein
LATESSGGLVFQTADCGERHNVFGVALELSDSADAAKVALQRVRSTVKGAYIKRCTVTPRSLLALRLPAVDSSIANVPDDAVNWEDSDRVSTAVRSAGQPTTWRRNDCGVTCQCRRTPAWKARAVSLSAPPHCDVDGGLKRP